MTHIDEVLAQHGATTQGTIRNGSLQAGANGLTSPQTVSALLEAHGFGLQAIEQYVGTSRSQIHGWRRDADYLAQIEQFRSLSVGFLNNEINELRAKLLSAAKKAVDTLIEGLEAESMAGNPNWNARLTAATTLLMQAIQIYKVDAESWRDTGTNEAPKTAVIVVQPDGTVTAREGSVVGSD